MLSTVVQPSDPPVFTGSLQLLLKGGMEPIARRLLSLPGGIHFRELTLAWRLKEDILSTIELVEMCSRALECLGIACGLIGTSIQYPRPHSCLTPISSQLTATFGRPLEGEETQRGDLSG
jgi:hypothetical protein